MSDVEYLYGETLRWSFGFDNPNKAAVIFACLLPLCWLAWSASWNARRLWLRIPSILVSGLIVLGVGSCLLMTFSRGGLVAALFALGYMWFQAYRNTAGRWRETLRKPYAWFSMGMIVALISLAIWCGIAERSTAGVVGDASISHRALLWKGALQMAHDNPTGFGSGRSGTEYMQWYQPQDRREGYRTMVNSYLTFLVEQGWLFFGLCVAFLAGFWRWSAPMKKGEKGADELFTLRVALRASVMAFLVAGFFSTTMENGWLWIIPSLSAAVLAAITIYGRGAPRWKGVLGGSVVMTSVLLGMLWGTGWYFSSRDPLVRTCGVREGVRSVVAVSTRHPVAMIQLRPDPSVMGEVYGKLVRALTLASNARVNLEGTGRVDLLLATGEKCFEKNSPESRTTLWIAPPAATDLSVGILEQSTNPILLLVPEIDEDGRASWWKTHSAPRIQLTTLPGIGTRIDQAWDNVIALVKDQIARKK